MSDDEADPELLALLRQSLLGPDTAHAPPSTGVLKSAEYIYDNAIDVSISLPGTKAAAAMIWKMMKERDYSTRTWSEHELHPKAKDESTVNFIFTMNLLNFSFWSDRSDNERYAVEYKGRKWTGYWSLVAALQRGIEQGYPITTPSFYSPDNITTCTDLLLAHIFRSCTAEPMPLLAERIAILREAGALFTPSTTTPTALIASANNSASQLVNTLTSHLPSLNDTRPFHSCTISLHKRAQILVADLWACFSGTSYGEFHDIDTLTMFADYRVPQMLHSLGCLLYSPRLEGKIKRLEELRSGEEMEVEIRGCSVWGVELIRREIIGRFGGEVETWKLEGDRLGVERTVNAVLIDYLLYDVAKERERDRERVGEEGGEGLGLPHHRTRSIWY